MTKGTGLSEQFSRTVPPRQPHIIIEENRLISESTDPLGNISVQETDSRGNIVRVARKDKTGRQLTEVTYRYNEMGEMLNAFDAKGHPVSVAAMLNMLWNNNGY